MKYSSRFQNGKSETFSVSSMEEYVSTPGDIDAFSKVLSDGPVYKYITDDAMNKYGHPHVRSLAIDILDHSALRWAENKEKRFLLRAAKGDPVGMIGVTLKGLDEGELWYYTTSHVGACVYEALLRVFDFLGQEGVKSLFARVDEGNMRSAQILSKLGFEQEKSEDGIVWRKSLEISEIKGTIKNGI